MSTYYFVPSRNVFGEGSVAETGHLMKSLGGTKAMIVTDEFFGLQPHDHPDSGHPVGGWRGFRRVWQGRANPKDTNVVEGETFYHENRCDCILSLGGGSSHDCAKAIAWWLATAARLPTMRAWIRPMRPCLPWWR